MGKTSAFDICRIARLYSAAHGSYLVLQEGLGRRKLAEVARCHAIQVSQARQEHDNEHDGDRQAGKQAAGKQAAGREGNYEHGGKENCSQDSQDEQSKERMTICWISCIGIVFKNNLKKL